MIKQNIKTNMKKIKNKNQKKILFTCTYSSGISGVWNRVYNVSRELIKRSWEVYVFSSNLEAGTLKEVKSEEIVDGIHCFRFKVKSRFGSKNAYGYNSNELNRAFDKINPNIVDCQTFRHLEGNVVAKRCAELKIPCFLTTHASFVNVKVRGLWLSTLTNMYDVLFARAQLRRFKKIIAITKWEYPYLHKLGIENNKIEYVPNGIPKEFFIKKQRITKAKGKVKKILFFGRIAPVKDIETLIKAFSVIQKNRESGDYRDIKLDIIGPSEISYKNKLLKLINELKVKNISFKGAVYKVNDKVKTYQSAGIFVLPSKREGMPQSLIESMSSGNIVIASDIIACKELVRNGENGFLFEQGDASDLANKIEYIIKNYRKLNEISKSAISFSSNFKWDKIVDKLENLYINA
ncbi:glycosyltransferase family 4 protein [Candidatus Pacearchaeota archaeon]|nr:glycosyltransferase family 4 protein [Candidatus Pacearchaeota archaeon]